MPRTFFRVAMFLSSYSPLFVLLAFRNWRTGWARWGLLASAVISASLLIVVMLSKRDEHGPALTIKHAKPQDGEVLAYIATYLIPFFSLDLGKPADVGVFGGFLVVLMVVYVNSSMLFVNPLLSVALYHTFEIEDPDGHTYTMITRRKDVLPGQVLTPSQITRFVRLEVTKNDRRTSTG